MLKAVQVVRDKVMIMELFHAERRARSSPRVEFITFPCERVNNKF